MKRHLVAAYGLICYLVFFATFLYLVLFLADSVVRPDLILLDLHMPGMDGPEFLEHVQRDASLRAIPVIAFTSTRHPEDAAWRPFCAGVVRKPLDMPGLRSIVEAFPTRWFAIVVVE